MRQIDIQRARDYSEMPSKFENFAWIFFSPLTPERERERKRHIPEILKLPDFRQLPEKWHL